MSNTLWGRRSVIACGGGVTTWQILLWTMRLSWTRTDFIKVMPWCTWSPLDNPRKALHGPGCQFNKFKKGLKKGPNWIFDPKSLYCQHQKRARDVKMNIEFTVWHPAGLQLDGLSVRRRMSSYVTRIHQTKSMPTHISFQPSFAFVAEDKWNDWPNATVVNTHTMDGGAS